MVTSKRDRARKLGGNGFSSIDAARNWHAAQHKQPYEGCSFCANMNPRQLKPGLGKEDVMKGLPPYDGNNSNRGADGSLLEPEREQRRMRMRDEARIRLGSPKAGT